MPNSGRKRTSGEVGLDVCFRPGAAVRCHNGLPLMGKEHSYAIDLRSITTRPAFTGSRSISAAVPGCLRNPTRLLMIATANHSWRTQGSGSSLRLSTTEIVGVLTACVLPLTSREGSELMIYDLAVDESHQRRGVGRRLVNEVLTEAKANGIDVAWVPAANEDFSRTRLLPRNWRKRRANDGVCIRRIT
jgi:GNAT superfamily N-acetyltransferase